MRFINWFGALIPFALLSLSALGQPSPISQGAKGTVNAGQLPPGVVVEKVASRSAGENAGLQEADVIFKWSYANVQGIVGSPFDLAQVELEQGPRGVVKLIGQRGAETRTWMIGAGEWGISARPNFPASLLLAYNKGHHPETTDDPAQAAEIWHDALSAADTYPSSWLSSWILFHAANILVEKKAWSQADSFFDRSLQKAEHASPYIKAQILKPWSRIFIIRSDWANAENLCKRALEESRESGSREPCYSKLYGLARKNA